MSNLFKTQATEWAAKPLHPTSTWRHIILHSACWQSLTCPTYLESFLSNDFSKWSCQGVFSSSSTACLVNLKTMSCHRGNPTVIRGLPRSIFSSRQNWNLTTYLNKPSLICFSAFPNSVFGLGKGKLLLTKPPTEDDCNGNLLFLLCFPMILLDDYSAKGAMPFWVMSHIVLTIARQSDFQPTTYHALPTPLLHSFTDCWTMSQVVTVFLCLCSKRCLLVRLPHCAPLGA